VSGKPLSPAPGKPWRLLVVEDERSLAATLSDRLVAEGYAVEVSPTGEAALEALASSPFDLVLLDVMLPGMDGFGVCMELRRRGFDLPVLMLTARAEVREKILGLKLGADDYLGKPFDMLELLARVEALLRRRPSAPEGLGSHEFGDVMVDLRSAAVTRGGEPVPLSTMEYRLLGCFLQHKGEVLSREQLLDEVWGYDSSVYSRTVDVHVATLRQKIEANPSRPRFVVTVHRVGYRFDG
jgi:two-component system alkaline phosphatase synthesis response regulator PhoP